MALVVPNRMRIFGSMSHVGLQEICRHNGLPFRRRKSLLLQQLNDHDIQPGPAAVKVIHILFVKIMQKHFVSMVCIFISLQNCQTWMF